MNRDTIAAIATAVGGGIGIVRVSGQLAEEVGRAVCHPWPTNVQSHLLYVGRLQAIGAEEVIDQVMFCLMRAPRSYTGEDVLEIHGHGGKITMERILQACLQAGCRLAEPGEYTKRAFLSGKLDLTQAEAVASLVGAQTLQAAKHAQRQLFGGLTEKVKELRGRTIGLLGGIEGALDFPDLEEDRRTAEQTAQELKDLSEATHRLAETFSQAGKSLYSGIELVFVGKTNAGKSSLINALCKQERVLVDEQPGTTRDYVEVRTSWDGIPVLLIDTAGERQNATALEKQGLRLAKGRAQQADLVLLIVDGTQGRGAEEERLLQQFEGVPLITVWNKMDQAGYLTPSDAVVTCSALCDWGLEPLKQQIMDRLLPSMNEECVVLQARQAQMLQEAYHCLLGARQALLDGGTWDSVATDLRGAVIALGQLTGEEVNESVVDEIFAQFCIGK